MIRLTDLDGGVHQLEMGNEVTFEEVTSYLGRLDELLDHGRPFSLILSYLDGKPKQSRDADRAEKEWLRTHRSRFSLACRGIVFVHDGNRIEKMLRRMVTTGVAPRFFGCPCRLHDDVGEAERWCRERLAD